MRILVAMSGGVDSSVVACLLKEQGHDVIGVNLELWHDPLAPADAQILSSKCCTTQTRSRMRTVAKNLGIPLHILSLEEQFKSVVVDPFLAACRRGLTPNPCVLCNRTFKFAHMLILAKSLHCDAVATGHYARVTRRKLKDGKIVSALIEAKDKMKDQSYFLHRLTQKELKHAVFPLGNLQKTEVFALAKRFGIPFDRTTYRESQDLCFFPEKSPAAFLRRHIRDAKGGPITLLSGTVVGQHEGLPFYTIGQRRGLNVGGQKAPVYVVQKEQKNCSIVVAPLGAELQSSIEISSLTFTLEPLSKGRRHQLTARIRAKARKVHGVFIHNGQRGLFHFDRPVSAVTPGQSLVLYRGQEVLGGGIIQGRRRLPKIPA
ncbi:MAG TPA: tRNA 2-thiouridine(34) synthase MnmA [Candidatus Peribacter riflensis]|uniref:tRNA-specific 2-thiouridylase MnmA n=1 Tax=Candidatus Peribacter riflensis TaxID=1735162 RepID=A0A0S1SH60_9BACT|nr:MAG: tRNA (5-methylaminomethyl-2-thiouridylate)-methyltransferase [Candidatus Peribacter riflensis]OGJ78318.1 MAG: tRNA 2-thiouridine(34) synthase MnmA [Candidatus Peribacteria bacterium RIFOXYB1_FULL_57_12]OGJ81128.1 MAG: tRNA 2-thiouridine(34) synthase MnmA [Candidatus Peribacteria bacterium RIFOXYC1_FULL_58_8]ALM10852.1 MAG: tRNA (5-methylaminomethyl-2-thiouridylate)-methyltransferase [Candidatus Peribacter riflensis]ALM11954.1 MAG: tRNA-specific 2-thiouridylase [Candidatus Peribacter rif